MTLQPLEKSLLLVVDPAPTFPLILNVILRRADCTRIEVVAFQTTALATFWLSGEMDRRKATKYPFGSPWDASPTLRPPTMAIVSLGFLPDERDRVMDRLSCQFPKTAVITTSTREEYLTMDDRWDEVYWRRVVSHLPRPTRDTDVIERVTPLLCGGQF